MTDQTRDDVEACFRNARDLLRAAKRLLEDEKLPNISFHLAVLALEEVGKAVMLGTRDIMRAVDGETLERRIVPQELHVAGALTIANAIEARGGAPRCIGRRRQRK